MNGRKDGRRKRLKDERMGERMNDWVDGLKLELMDGLMDRRMKGWMDGQVDEWMVWEDESIEEWTDGWMDGRTNWWMWRCLTYTFHMMTCAIVSKHR